MKTVIEQAINTRKVRAAEAFSEYMQYRYQDWNENMNPLVTKSSANEWDYKDILCLTDFSEQNVIVLTPENYSGGKDEPIALELIYLVHESASVYVLLTLQQLFYEIDEGQGISEKEWQEAYAQIRANVTAHLEEWFYPAIAETLETSSIRGLEDFLENAETVLGNAEPPVKYRVGDGYVTVEMPLGSNMLQLQIDYDVIYRNATRKEETK